MEGNDKTTVAVAAVGIGIAWILLSALREREGKPPGGLKPGRTLTCDIPDFGPVELTLKERVIEDGIAWWLVLNHQSEQEEWITEENLLICTGQEE